MADYSATFVTILVIWISFDSGHRRTNLIGFLRIHFDLLGLVRCFFSVSPLLLDLLSIEHESYVVKRSHMSVLIWTSLTYPLRKLSIEREKKGKRKEKRRKRKTKISWRGQSSSPYTFRLGRGWYIYCTRYAEQSGEVLHKNIFDARKKIVNFSVYNLLCTLDTHVSTLLMFRPVSAGQLISVQTLF